MVAFGFYGSSNSGKTTVIEELIRALKERGYEVIAVKHTHLDVRADEGKDTQRFRKAGALFSVLSAKEQSSIVLDRALGIEEILRVMEPLCDVVLVEGFKGASIKNFVFGDAEETESTIFRYSDERFEEVLEIIERAIGAARGSGAVRS
ncbi:MAG: molybdopterin-guanine dinucleotide biosynthesis protein B [Candidatus Thermoplasmatota archaeon]|nr:molybdopterin-guanine dinucleotide biosynthesis protein B [Candidatus Thermoplasmatota archaeon]